MRNDRGNREEKKRLKESEVKRWKTNEKEREEKKEEGIDLKKLWKVKEWAREGSKKEIILSDEEVVYHKWLDIK